MKPKDWIIVLILVTGVVTKFDIITPLMSIIFISVSYVTILFISMRSAGNVYTLPFTIFTIVIFIILLHFINIGFYRVQEATNLVPPIVMICVFLTNLVVVPQVASKRIFYYSVSRFSFMLALISLLMLPFIGQFNFISDNLFRGGAGAYKYGVFIPRPTSLIHNPNNFAKLLFVGAVSTIGLHQIKSENHNYIIFAVIVVTLTLTQSRGSIVALLISLFIFTHHIFNNGSKIFNIIVLIGVSSFLVLFPLLATTFLPGSALTGRVYLWDATITSIRQGPLTGQGFGTGATYIKEFLNDPSHVNTPHNAFLYTSLRLGIVGGLLYIFLISYPIYLNIKQKMFDVSLIMLGVGLITIQIIDGVSALFLNTESFLHALILGYLLSDLNYNSNYSEQQS